MSSDALTVRTVDGREIPLDSIEQFIDNGSHFVATIGKERFTLKPEVNRRLLWALDYANTGWCVFPVPQGEKKSHKSAEFSGGNKWGMTRDKGEIIADWRTWPDANVGLPTGEVNGFFVLEADTKAGHDVDGLASIAELEKEHGPLPETLMAESPSGSVHRYFKHPGAGIKVNNSASTVAPGVDMRGDGGMVVAPPSIRKGVAYRWLNNTDIADAPQWLLDIVTKVDHETPKAEATADPQRVAAALAVIPNDDLGWDDWNKIGLAIYRATSGSRFGLAMFQEFSAKSSKHDEKVTSKKWKEYHACPPSEIGAGSLFWLATQSDPDWEAGRGLISLSDFVSYLPESDYIYLRTLAYWPTASVNKRLPWIRVGTDKDGTPIYIPPSKWLDQNRRVEVQTWLPGQPTLIEGHEFTESDGLKPHPDATTFNQYVPPTIMLGNACAAQPYIDLAHELYPNEAEHILDCFAHRRQRPGEKINHALVLGGTFGIGKDTLVLGVHHAIGSQNFRLTSPDVIVSSQFNPEYKSVVLLCSEAHDLGIGDRIKFYNVIKDKLASPPINIRINEKHRKPYYIANLCFVIMTTNYRTGGIYLPAEDRRHFVAWSDAQKGDRNEQWWSNYYAWFYREGAQHIAAYLQERDLSRFNPKAEPAKTEAWHAMVNASRSSEELELASVLELFDGKPVTLGLVTEGAEHLHFSNLAGWLAEARNFRAASARMEEAGYTIIRNPDDDRGRWRVKQRGGSTRPRVVYGPARGLSEDQRRAAARLFKDRTEALAMAEKPDQEPMPF